MAWNGSGSYQRTNGSYSGSTVWNDDANAGYDIVATRHDTHDQDLAQGINACLTKNGENTPTANLPMGGFKHTGVANASAATDYMAYGQIRNGQPLYLDTANNRIGIGTSSPGVILDVQQAGYPTQYIHGFVADGGAPGVVFRKSRGATIGTHTIVQNGDGLGTISFQGANGTDYTTGAQVAAIVDGTPGASNDMPTKLVVRTTPDGSGTPTDRFELSSAGLLRYIVTSTAYVRTASTGTTNTTHFAFSNGNGDVGFINTSGTSTSYATSSDYRLKENVTPMSGALARINALSPCTFTWKADGTPGEGFIAHELAQQFPAAVFREKDQVDANGTPQYQGVDTGHLVAAITAAIKELDAKLTSLASRVTALEA